jgi:hypothetical protein
MCCDLLGDESFVRDTKLPRWIIAFLLIGTVVRR